MSTPAAPGPSDSTKDVERRRSLGKYVKRMSSVFKREKSSKSSASSSPATPSASAPTPILEKREEEEEASASAAAPSPVATPAPAPALTTEPTTATTTPATAVATELNRSTLQQERARALFAKYGLTLESHEWISTPAHPINVQRVEKPIRMRVHRSCHHCGTTYGADKVCNKCEHKRCKKCPRYPKKKAPVERGKEKEPGEKPKRKKLLMVTSRSGEDRVYQPVKQRVRRTCHKCESLFIPPTSTVCEKCRHVRCTKCPRDPAKLSKWPNGYPGDMEPDSETEVERDIDLELAKRVWRKPRTRVRWECEECQSMFIEGSPQCPGCGHERCEKCTRKPLKRAKKEQQFDPVVIKTVEAKLRALAVDHGPPSPNIHAS